MATTTTTRTKCDLCAYDSTNASLFSRRDGFDFCRWCMSGPTQRTECGGHAVDLANDGSGSWSCSCGETSLRLTSVLRAHGVRLAAMDAVPHYDAATAAIHVQTPNWPQTW